MAESLRLVDRVSGAPARLVVRRAVASDAADFANLATKACGRTITKENIIKLDLAAKTVCVAARFTEPNLLMGYSSAILGDNGAYAIKSLVLLEPSDIGTTAELIHGLIRELKGLGAKTISTWIGKDKYEFYAEFGFRATGMHRDEAVQVVLTL